MDVNMLIALDYDDTYTRAPDFWDAFIGKVAEEGHEIIIATMRSNEEWARIKDDMRGIRIVCTNRKAKKPFCASLGLLPDIWIDDNPQFIIQDAWTGD